MPVRRGSPADIARLPGDELALAVVAPETPEGELIPREDRWRFGAYAGGLRVLNLAFAGLFHRAPLVVALGARRARDL